MVIIDFIQTIIDAIGNVGSGFLDAISGFVGGLGDLSSGSSAPDVEVPVDPEVPGDDAPVDETPGEDVPADDTPVEPEVPVEDAPVDETPEVDAEV